MMMSMYAATWLGVYWSKSNRARPCCFLFLFFLSYDSNMLTMLPLATSSGPRATRPASVSRTSTTKADKSATQRKVLKRSARFSAVLLHSHEHDIYKEPNLLPLQCVAIGTIVLIASFR